MNGIDSTSLPPPRGGKPRKRGAVVRRTLWWAVSISAVLHLVTVWRIGVWGGEARRDRELRKPLTVRINPVRDPAAARQDRSIVETKQTPTEPPRDKARLGAQDHRAERETRVANRPQQKSAEDSARPGFDSNAVSRPEPEKRGSDVEISSDPHGQVRVVRKGKTRNAYEALLQEQMARHDKSRKVPGTLKGGRTEYLDEDLAEGDRVDLNTTNYKYLSYFIGLRKSIELTWVYPSKAVRQGMQGEVRLEFKIEKDGRMTRIRILDSSGYEILDRAIIDAIKLAAPFAPLPKSMAKDSLVVTATFRYVLYAYNSP